MKILYFHQHFTTPQGSTGASFCKIEEQLKGLLGDNMTIRALHGCEILTRGGKVRNVVNSWKKN